MKVPMRCAKSYSIVDHRLLHGGYFQQLSHEALVLSFSASLLLCFSAVGIIGGEPKCCKSFLALDIAVSVASAKPCLSYFRADQQGKALIFAAEDSLSVVKERLERISLSRGSDLRELDIDLITAASLRLDLVSDQRRLELTIAQLRPTLLILDPFVRLHRIDENSSSEVAPLLAFLRELQRRYSLAIIVVHHARKGATHLRAGQALRGSSEFHAWGDSNLYLQRDKAGQISLSIEHRSEADRGRIFLSLNDKGKGCALEVLEKRSEPSPLKSATPESKVRHVLLEANDPLKFSALRNLCKMRTVTLSETLKHLLHNNIVLKTADGYLLRSQNEL